MHELVGTVAITGAHGYLGRHVVREVAKDCNVLALVSPRAHAAVDGHPTRHIDLASGWEEDIRRALLSGAHAPSAVVHLAGLASVGGSYGRERAYTAVNAEGTAKLVREARQCGVQHLILASTMAVYADSESQPIDERHPVAPGSPYAASKLQAEAAALEERGEMRVTILRLTNLAGRASDLAGIAHAGVSVDMARRAVAGEDIPIAYGYATEDGTVMRDFLHVSDAARAVAACLTREGPDEAVFNVASGWGTTLQQLARLILDEAGSASGTEPTADRRPGEPAVRVANIAAARGALGWAPALSLGRIVQDEVADARSRMLHRESDCPA